MQYGWSTLCNWVSGRVSVKRGEGVSGCDCDHGTTAFGSLLGNLFSSSGSDRLCVLRHNTKAAATSLQMVLSKASSILLDSQRKHQIPVALVLAAAIWPSVDDIPLSKGTLAGELSLGTKYQSVQELTRMTVTEPTSGVHFPLHLQQEDVLQQLFSPPQVLAGVGVRCRQLMKLKSIHLYAFGMYVQPDVLRAQLGNKYAGVAPEDLKYRPEFYDDLLMHEVRLTVRLVVLYKGLTAKLVRSAFQVSLKNRMKKLTGDEDDEGLRAFCSYLSDDLEISKGTTIDFHWQTGGRLHTVVDGREIGTISSKQLCRAFFDLYIGDPPVSNNAKHSIGESFARMLND